MNFYEAFLAMKEGKQVSRPCHMTTWFEIPKHPAYKKLACGDTGNTYLPDYDDLDADDWYICEVDPNTCQVKDWMGAEC